MTAAIASVSKGNRDGIRRLPLHIQGVVDGVRKHVALVVDAEVQRRGAEEVSFLTLPAAAVLAKLIVLT